MTRVGLLHPGEMGAAIAAQIVGNDHRVMWCPAGRSAASTARAEAAGLEPVVDLARLVSESDILLSICPPAAATDVAAGIADVGFAGIYVDANAISPTRMQHIADLLTPAGAAVVDGAIIGPPPSDRRGARLYLSGPRVGTSRTADLVRGTCVHTEEIGERLGLASALKMAFASYQKSARALAAIAHALAEHHGVTDALLTEARCMPTDILADRAFFPTLADRAWRWAPEMNEIATTLEAAALPSDLAQASAEVLARWQAAT